MAEVNFTEKERQYVRECEIDKKGVLVTMPASPFPSFYRKGVISKRKDQFVVSHEFRGMFYLAGQKPAEPVELEADRPPAVDAAQDATATYGKLPKLEWPDKTPEDIAEFRAYLNQNLTLKATKCDDELRFIDPVKDAREFAWKLQGDGVDAEEASGIGKRKAWRGRLSRLCAGYFGCEARLEDRDVYFKGDEHFAAACKYAYVYLFKLGNRIAQRTYDDALAAEKPTRGVYNKVADDFLCEVEKRFDAWAVEWDEAHIIKDPVTGEAVGEISNEFEG